MSHQLQCSNASFNTRDTLCYTSAVMHYDICDIRDTLCHTSCSAVMHHVTPVKLYATPVMHYVTFMTLYVAPVTHYVTRVMPYMGFVHYIATTLYYGIGYSVRVRAWLRVLFWVRVRVLVSR